MGTLNTTVGSIDSFLGIRNTLRPEREPKNSLAEAENVILLDDGSVEGRFGYTKTSSLTSVTDAYEHKSLRYCLVVSNGSLLAIDEALGVKTLKTGLTDTQFSWTQVEDRVAFVGAVDSGIVVSGERVLPLRLPYVYAPLVTPQAGSMTAGTYGFRQILRHVETGIESGASTPIYYELSSPGGFLVQANNIPAGYEADIYVTPADDSSFQYLDTTTSSNILYDCDPLNLKNTLELYQDYSQSLPDSVSAVAFHETCLWAAVWDQVTNTSMILSSEPFFYHLFKIDEEGFAVTGKVQQMMSTPEGLLIGTDLGIWVRDVQDNLVRVADYGVVSGKPMYKDQEGKVIIWTKRGLVTFAPFKNVFYQKLSVAPGLSCAATIVDIKGSKYSFVMTDTGGTPYNKY